MGDISGLYPQPPQPVAPPTNGFSNLSPTGVVGLVQGINSARLFQQQYDAREGVANAYKNNVNPDGSLNQQGLAVDLAKSGFGAGEALHQGTVNTQARFDLEAKQNQYALDSIATLAEKPNPTKADLVALGVNMSRNVPSVPTDKIQAFIDKAPENPREFKKYLVTQKNRAIGPLGLQTTATGTIDQRTGVAPSISQGQANYQNVGVGEGQPANNGPGRVTALPVGSSSAMLKGL